MGWQSDSYIFDVFSVSGQLERQLCSLEILASLDQLMQSRSDFVLLQYNCAHFAVEEVSIGTFTG